MALWWCMCDLPLVTQSHSCCFRCPTIPSILTVTSMGHAGALGDIEYVFIMAAKSSVD